MKNRKRFIQLLIITCVMCSAIAAFFVNNYIDKNFVSEAADDSNEYVCSTLPNNTVKVYDATPASTGALYVSLTEDTDKKSYYIRSEQDFIDLANFSKENDTSGYSFTINNESQINLNESFFGIGSETNPFKGTMTYNYSNTNCIINLKKSTALFAHISDSASVSKLDIRCDNSMGGFAQVLHVNGSMPSDNLQDIVISGNVKNSLNGKIFSDDDVNSGLSDAGMLFGSIESAGTNDVTIQLGGCSVADDSSVNSAYGNAGAIIGSIASSTADVKLNLYKDSTTVYNDGYTINSDTSNAGGIIGSITGNVVLVVPSSGLNIDDISQVSSTGGNAGIVAGAILSGGLSVKLSGDTDGDIILTGSGTSDIVKAVAYSAAATPELTGNAGAVVGYLSNIAHFNAGDVSITNEMISAGTSAGGVFGYVNYDTGTVITTGIVTVNGGTIGNAYYNGGYIGRLDAHKALTIDDKVKIGNINSNAPKLTSQDSFSLGSALTGTNASKSHGSGGLIGYVSLVNTDGTSSLTIDYSASITQQIACELTATGSCLTGSGSGGIIGVYNSGSVKNTLLVKGKSGGTTPLVGSAMTTSTENAMYAYGGLIGLQLTNSYCEVTDMSSTTSNTSAYSAGTGAMNAVNFGGITGYVSSNAILNISDIKVDGVMSLVNRSNSGCARISSGGIAGFTSSASVIRFTGNTTLGDNCYANADYIDNSHAYLEIGQLVGYQDNSLIYADHNSSEEDWSLTRNNNSSIELNTASSPNVLDDISNYGRVIRNDCDKLSGLITFDDTLHTVTVENLAGVTSTSISLGSPKDFAKLAITLNSRGYVSAVSGYSSSNYQKLVNSSSMKISITSNIDLTGTGIECLNRNDSANGNNDRFKGTLDGNSNTVTLAIGETYGTVGKFGNGEVVGHQYLGMFAYINGASISNLNVTGSINCAQFYNNSGATYSLYNDRDIYAGGITGQANSNININNVNTSVKINERNSITKMRRKRECYGGLIGYYTVSTNVYNLNITDSVNESEITINCLNASTNYCMTGGLVGDIECNANTTVGVNLSNIVSSGKIETNESNVITPATVQAGGLVGVITSNAAAPSASNVNALGIKVDGQIMNINASSTTGGHLGYRWTNVNVKLGKYTKPDNTVVNNSIDGDITVTGKANYGGLLYEVTGKLDVSDTTVTGTFTGSNTRTGTSDGLLVCQGKNLYAIIRKPTVHILEGETDSMTTGSGAYYDDLIGNNIQTFESNIAQYGGILTIEQGSTPLESVGSITSPWVTDHVNRNCRYYYNLEGIDKDHNSDVLGSVQAETGTMTERKTLLLWHVLNYVSTTDKTAWPNYYFNNSTVTYMKSSHSYTVNTNIDMTDGFCIYPTTLNYETGFDFSDNTITFAYDTLNTKFTNALTSDASTLYSQHYMMQSALFNNANASLTVQNVTLSGTAGRTTGTGTGVSSGALIMGTVTGTYDSDNKRVSNNLVLDGVTLNNLFISDVTSSNVYAPLLVNKINTCVNATISDVNTIYSGSTTKAGTSFIGNVGSATATYLSVNYTKMIIEGLKSTAVLTKATFMNSFNYLNDGSSSGSYNFYIAEDWPVAGDSSQHYKHVTYGYELTDAQTEYYDAEISLKVNPDNYPTNSVYDFKTSYLPYVAGTGNQTLRVNIKSGDLNVGCGTYADPYEISTTNQFMAVYNYVNIGTSSLPNGWKVNFPKNTSDGDNHMYCDKTGNDHSLLTKGSSSDFDSKITRKWISQAYYKITSVIDLTGEDSFTGLGSAVCPFEGIIVGDNCTIKMPIMLNADKITNMGLVNYAGGCVIKNVTVNYSGLNYLSSTKASYFGGILGNVIGGDNIIDNCSVSGISETSTANRIIVQSRMTYAGGYVGYLQSGGVIFRNMGTSSNSAIIYNNATSTSVNNQVQSSSSNYYYANPYIGRVLDGYAIAESGTSIDNTNKNYKVATLSGTKDSVKVDYLGVAGNSGVQHNLVDIQSAEGLLVFSQVLNSGGCSTGLKISDGACAYGTYNLNLDGNVLTTKVRLAQYNNVGNVTDNTDADFKQADKDCNDINSDTNSYLIDRYFLCDSKTGMSSTKAKANCLTIPLYRASLMLSSDCNMNSYGNGFRGLGGRYKTVTVNNASGDRTRLFLLDRTDVMVNGSKTEFYAFDGKNKTVSYSTDVKQYINDMLLAKNFGLLNTANHKNRTNTGQTANQFGSHYKDVVIGGETNVDYYDDNGNETSYTGDSIIGGFISSFEQDTNAATEISTSFFENIKINNMSINAPSSITGGIIGSVALLAPIKLTDCWYEGLQITSGKDMGGIIGNCTANKTNSTNYKFDLLYSNCTYAGKDSEFVKTGAATSCGGILGNVGSSGTDIALSIDGKNIDDLNCKLSGVNINMSVDSAQNSKSGGVIGNSGYTTTINNLDLVDSIICADNYSNFNVGNNQGYAGGFVAYMTKPLTVDNCNIYSTITNGIANNTIVFGGEYSAGIIAINSENVTINNCNINTKEDSGIVRIESNTYTGGLITYSTKSGGTISLNNNNIGNNATKTVIYSKNNKSSAMIAYPGIQWNDTSPSTLNVNSDTSASTTIKNCSIISNSNSVSGVAASFKAIATVNVNNVTIESCDFVSGENQKYMGGIIAEAYGNAYLNSISIKNNKFISFNTNSYYPSTGTLVSRVAKDVYGNKILIENNTYGRCTGTIIGSTYIQGTSELGTITAVGASANRTGMWFYSVGSSSNINLTAVNIDTTTKPEYAPWATGTPASSVIVYNDHDNVSTTGAGVADYPQKSWAVGADNSPITWKGNAVIEGLPQKIATDVASDDRKYNLYGSSFSYLLNNDNELNVKTLQDYTGDFNSESKTMPILYINGDPNGILTEYINMLTNGGFNSAMAVDSYDFYRVETFEYDVTADMIKKVDVSEGEDEKGSIKYDTATKTFVPLQNYDNLDENGGHFTVLTVTFRNQTNNSDINQSSWTTNNNIMTIDIPVYYPQVLDVQSHIRVEDHEEYYIKQFTSANNSRSSNISKGGTFTAYVEYDYNELSRYDDWNYEKYLSVTNAAGDHYLNLPKDTLVTMIDINAASADNYQAYYYKVLDENTHDIVFKNFKSSSDVNFQVTDMNLLNLLSSCDNLYNNPELDSTDNYSIERYILVFDFPAEDSDLNDSQIYYLNAGIDYAEGVAKNVTLTEDSTDKSFVTVWKQPEANIDINGNNRVISTDSAVIATTDIEVDFPQGYCNAMTGGNQQNYKYGVLRYYITDSTNANEYSLPVGTRISVNGNTSTINNSTRYYEYVINDNGGNPKNILSDAVSTNVYNYSNTISLDFSAVSQAVMSTTFGNIGNYNLHCDMYITSDAAHIASGQKCLGQTPLPLSAEIRTGSILYVSVDSESLLHLGCNPKDTTDETNDGVIDFRGLLDMSQCDETVINSIINADINFEFKLYKKIKTIQNGDESSQYTEVNISDYISKIELNNANNSNEAPVEYSTNDSSNITGNKLTGKLNSTDISSKYFDNETSISLPFTVTTKKIENLDDYANYKLELTLTNTLSDTASLIDCRDHFIYTVANIYTDFINKQ